MTLHKKAADGRGDNLIEDRLVAADVSSADVFLCGSRRTPCAGYLARIFCAKPSFDKLRMTDFQKEFLVIR
jgi:hypothetical protein